MPALVTWTLPNKATFEMINPHSISVALLWIIATNRRILFSLGHQAMVELQITDPCFVVWILRRGLKVSIQQEFTSAALSPGIKAALECVPHGAIRLNWDRADPHVQKGLLFALVSAFHPNSL